MQDLEQQRRDKRKKIEKFSETVKKKKKMESECQYHGVALPLLMNGELLLMCVLSIILHAGWWNGVLECGFRSLSRHVLWKLNRACTMHIIKNSKIVTLLHANNSTDCKSYLIRHCCTLIIVQSCKSCLIRHFAC